MRETERRIQQYMQMLPHVREKVAATAILLVMSLVMMTSATFAWLVISASPEVGNISTTIAANGNLEIALSDTKGKEPKESQEGDSGKDLLEKNKTWGNLVNLSDENYGLQNIILRPASLNEEELSTNPLFAASYSADGRIIKTHSDFAYGNYNPELDVFSIPDETQYGVRVISSVTYDSASSQQSLDKQLTNYRTEIQSARSKYAELTYYDRNNPSKGYMSAVSGLMAQFIAMQAGGGTSTTLDCTAYVPDLYNLMSDFQACMDHLGNAMAALVNIQALQSENAPTGFEVKGKDLQTIDISSLEDMDISMSSLRTWQNDYKNLLKHMQKLRTYYDPEKGVIIASNQFVSWAMISDVVDFMVKMATCTLTTNDGSKTIVVGNMVVKDALSFASSLLSAFPADAKITDGALKRFEQITGEKMMIQKLSVKVNLDGLSGTLYANVSTTATAPWTITTDYNTSMEDVTLKRTDMVAGDTYGMAIDFWVRTNTANYLILEGQVERDHKEIDGYKYYKDYDSNIVLEKDGKYYDEQKNELTFGSDDEKTEYIRQLIEVEVVVDFNGVNRVWDDVTLTEKSTTQGIGSCYIFYADTPIMQEQSLKLLEQMRIAFIDGDGKFLAEAIMNTEDALEENGRVTVPLALNFTKSIDVGTNEAGQRVYAITELQHGIAQRITAIVYIDGVHLTNDLVQATADIQGQLNIQFGGYGNLYPVDDEKLKPQEYSISATLSKTLFAEDDTDFTSNVALTISGLEPQEVKANFIRVINSYQGTRDDEIEFTYNEGTGKWEKSVNFDMPGNYVLRTVWVDGIEYYLDTPQYVTVEGFDLSTLYCSLCGSSSTASVMTDSSYVSTNVSLSFASDKRKPSSVQAVFTNEYLQQVVADLVPGTSDWTGSAVFTASGTYTLENVIIDGVTYPLRDNLKKKITLSIGMKAQVWAVMDNYAFEYTGPRTIQMQAMIIDNADHEQWDIDGGTEGIWLNYTSGVSIPRAELTWNQSLERYTGEFVINSPGIYNFQSLTVGDNTIGSASSAPTITAVSPYPVEFDTFTAIGTPMADGTMYQFAPNSDAVIKLRMLNSETAVSKVVFKNRSTGELYTVDSSNREILGGETGKVVTEWAYKIPNGSGGTQDGVWSVEKVLVGNAQYDGTFYIGTEVEDMVEIDLKGKTYMAQIGTTIKVYLEGENQEKTNYFLTSTDYTNSFTARFTDGRGVVIPASLISNVSVTYTLDTNSVTLDNVGYRRDSWVGVADHTATCSLSHDASETEQTKFIAPADSIFTFKYAGDYLPTISFEVGASTLPTGEVIPGRSYVAGKVVGGKVTLAISNANTVPIYTLKLRQPSVTIDSVSPDSNTKFKVMLNGSLTGATYYNSIDNTEATIATINTQTIQSKGLFSKYTFYTPSTVVLKLSGMGSQYKNASVSIANSGNTVEVATTFTANEDKAVTSDSIEVGEFSDWFFSLGGGSGYQTMTTMGEGTATTIEVTDKNDVVWEVKIPTVTIKHNH